MQSRASVVDVVVHGDNYLTTYFTFLILICKLLFYYSYREIVEFYLNRSVTRYESKMSEIRHYGCFG